MRTENLSLQALSSAANTLQNIILCFVAVIILVLFALMFRQLYILIFKPELMMGIRMIMKSREGKTAEREFVKNQLQENEQEFDEKMRQINQLNAETEHLMQELTQQGLEAEKAQRMLNMTLEQLTTLQDKEQNDMSGNYIINAITRRVLIDSEFKRREDVREFKVPENLTMDYTIEQVEKLNKSLFKNYQCGGRANMTFSVSNKTYAIIAKRQDGFVIKFKCGTYYAQQLSQLYPQFFSRSKFPAGLIWFEINNCNGCSLELVKLLITISYNIAKAGY